jgi:hypothetical protein
MTATAAATPPADRDWPVRLLPAPLIGRPFDDARDAPSPGCIGQAALPFPRVASEPVEDFDFRPTPRRALPEPAPWARTLAQATAEVVAGNRPVGQLLRWTTQEVYARIERAAARRPAVGPTGRPPSPVVRSVRLVEPADGVVEACAVVRTGRRSRALALRLEGLDGRWRCTALELG